MTKYGKLFARVLSGRSDANMELWIYAAVEFDRPIPESRGRRLQYA